MSVRGSTRRFFLVAWAVCLGAFPPAQRPARAVDFGLMLDQLVTLDDAFSGDIYKTSYSGNFIPWFSGMMIENGDLYLSASVGPQVENGQVNIISDLLRSEVILRSDQGMELRFGRTPYVDPLGLIANGLFDGFKVSQMIGLSSLSVGAWYTGLQYKKRANITVSPVDAVNYYTEFDSKNWNTYFAPRRMLAAVSWEHPALAEIVRLRVAALGQFDLNDEGDTYHSEYFIGKVTIPYRNLVVFDAGGALELLQIPDKEAKLGLMGEMGIAWMPPGGLNDRLGFMARIASGKQEDSPLGAFLPLTTVTQGKVLKAKLSGLGHFRLDYLARLHNALSLDVGASYFIKSTELGYSGWPVSTASDPDKYALGAEFYTALIWNPVSDFRMNFGGGVFLPQLGNAAPEERARWQFEMAVSMALY
jgi:hypothetical protein